MEFEGVIFTDAGVFACAGNSAGFFVRGGGVDVVVGGDGFDVAAGGCDSLLTPFKTDLDAAPVTFVVLVLVVDVVAFVGFSVVAAGGGVVAFVDFCRTVAFLADS